MSALNPKTPGVYTIEKNAFPPSVAEVPTAIPAFIGYTQKAVKNGVSLHNTPILINSLNEYETYFGGAPEFKFPITEVLPDPVTKLPPKPGTYDFSINGAYYKVGAAAAGSMYYLYNSLKFFYLNGGGPAYIVSVGLYEKPVLKGEDLVEEPNPADKDTLIEGLELLREIEFPKPTMILIPDSLLLDKMDCYTVQQQMVAQCGELMDRVAMLDIYDGWMARSDDDVITEFRNNIGINELKYGISYYPWLHTTVTSSSEVSFANVDEEPAAGGVSMDKLFPGQQAIGGLRQITNDMEAIENIVIPPNPLPGAGANTPPMPDWATAYKAAPTTAKEALVYKANVVQSMATQIYTLGNTGALTSPKIAISNEILKDTLKAMMSPQGALGSTLVKMATMDLKMPGGALGVITKASLGKLGITWDDSKAVSPFPAEYKAVTDAYNMTIRVWNQAFSLFLKSIFQGPSSAQTILMQLNASMENASRDYVHVMEGLASSVNLLPPCAAMAGVYTLVDNTEGVWTAPANLNINSVIAPAVKINDEQQEDLNVDALAGKSINAIRSFYGRGPAIIWGARTLDGNSQDWRYVNVRRTMIMIEQSVKNAAQQFVFDSNDAQTWTLIDSMISSFLNTLWTQGALQGASPADAFTVQVGLGKTMTPEDILNGFLRVSVKVAVVRPAEFIVITYEQQMAKSG